jgi:hypothetical protein
MNSRPSLDAAESQRDLYLFAAGDAAVDAPSVVEDAMDQRMVGVVDRQANSRPTR